MGPGSRTSGTSSPVSRSRNTALVSSRRAAGRPTRGASPTLARRVPVIPPDGPPSRGLSAAPHRTGPPTSRPTPDPHTGTYGGFQRHLLRRAPGVGLDGLLPRPLLQLEIPQARNGRSPENPGFPTRGARGQLIEPTSRSSQAPQSAPSNPSRRRLRGFLAPLHSPTASSDGALGLETPFPAERPSTVFRVPDVSRETSRELERPGVAQRPPSPPFKASKPRTDAGSWSRGAEGEETARLSETLRRAQGPLRPGRAEPVGG
jgi:hypothetical protein